MSWAMQIYKINTIINTCPQNSVVLIERFGKYVRTKQTGLFFAIPFIEKIKTIDLSELSVKISPLKVITSDNVALSVSGNIFFNFIDPYKAAYNSFDPIFAVDTHAQSSVRSCLGSMELDQILSGRLEINKQVYESTKPASEKWGMEIVRMEITEIMPDRIIIDAMNLQSQAERARRESELNAQGSKRSAELISQGERIKLVNESEGHLIQARNESDAEKYRIVTEAQGFNESEIIKAQGIKRSIEIIAEAAGGDPKIALMYLMADKQISMYKDIGSKSNTMFFQDKPADLNSLIAQAKSIFNST